MAHDEQFQEIVVERVGTVEQSSLNDHGSSRWSRSPLNSPNRPIGAARDPDYSSKHRGPAVETFSKNHSVSMPARQVSAVSPLPCERAQIG